MKSSASIPTPSSTPAASTVDSSGLHRALRTRHVALLALAGIIGSGLLVGSGGALVSGGPASLIISFGVVGIIAFSVMQSLGELTCLYPTGGAFATLADRFADKAFGTALGWAYFALFVLVMANEVNVLMGICYYWTPTVDPVTGQSIVGCPLWAWFLIWWSVFLAFQLIGVRAFGEAEFWLALLKICGLVAFFIFAIVYAAGGIIGQQESLGFRYWSDPGAFNGNGFRGVAKTFVFASTIYSGVESVAIAATETRNPGVAIPKAIRQVFWRILFIYMGSAFFFGLVCPANSEQLVGGSTTKSLQSPMTVAIQNAGWAGGVNLVNAFILLTVVSSVNSALYIGSRTVLHMAQDGKAPRFLGKTNKYGTPVQAIIFTSLFSAIALLNLGQGASQAFVYIVNLSGVAVFIVWGSISFLNIRLRMAFEKQGRSTDELPYKSFAYPWNAYFGLAANIFLALVQGWTSLSPFSAGDFVDAYILLPVFLLVFGGYKLAFQTRWWRLDEIDLDSGRRGDVDR